MPVAPEQFRDQRLIEVGFKYTDIVVSKLLLDIDESRFGAVGKEDLVVDDKDNIEGMTTLTNRRKDSLLSFS